ncbi:hypothetical protein [Amycolatopsis sp. NPDC004079]|uniref:hypothetical protein n=1 Tax=Amycolatopsis sp. NPDC004079 TaxID=3154549 RepID=UPI0033A9325A
MDPEAFLRHLEVGLFIRQLGMDASDLPEAPDGDAGPLIVHRTEDEVHRCFVCGQRAAVAFLVETQKDDRRWLDLCVRNAERLYAWALERAGERADTGHLFPEAEQ